MEKLNDFTICMPVTRVTPEMIQTINNFSSIRTESSEVIVVLDGSDDDGLLQAFYYLGEALRVICSGENHGPAYSRNIAATMAKNEVLIFIDYDVVVPREVFSFLASPEVGFANLPAVLPNLLYRNTVSEFFSEWALAPKWKEGALLAVSACFSVNRVDFRSVEGFREVYKKAAGEDWDFFSRLHNVGVEVNFDHNYKVFHENPKTVLGLGLRAFRYSYHGGESFRLSPAIQASDDSESALGLAPTVMLPFFLLSALVRLTLSYSSAGDSPLTKASQQILMFEKRFVASLNRLEPRPFLPRTLSVKGGKVLRAMQSINSASPWSRVAPVYADKPRKVSASYRLLVAYWKIFFIAGMAARLTRDLIRK